MKHAEKWILLASMFGIFTGTSEKASAAGCKPSVMSVRLKFNGIPVPATDGRPASTVDLDFRVIEQKLCDPDHSVFTWEPFLDGVPYGLELSSLGRGDQEALELAVETRMDNGMKRSDIRFYRDHIISRLRDASEASDDDERKRILAEARDLWADHLIKN